MIHVIETIEALPGKAEKLSDALQALVPLARAEKGCRSYDLYQQEDNPHHFVVTMCWDSREAYTHHEHTSHIQDFVDQFDKVLYGNVEEKVFRLLLL